jgi:serine/threonine protein kinase
MLYEMLTGGERPFTGERAGITGTTAEKVRWEHLHGKIVSPRKRNKTVPKYIEAAVMKCLEKAPTDRFQSVQDLFYALSHEEVEEKVEKKSPEEKDQNTKKKEKTTQEKKETATKSELESEEENKKEFAKIGAWIKKEWNLMTKQAKVVVLVVGAVLLISNLVFAYLAFKPESNDRANTDKNIEAQTMSSTEILPPTSTPLPIPQCELVDSAALVSGWQENYCATFSSSSEVDDWLVDDQINERVATVGIENYKNMLNVRAEMFQDLITYIQSPAEELRDYMVSVEGRLSSYAGHPYHEWGLVLKATDNSYYYFSIDSKNNYYFNLMRNGSQSNILNGRFSNDIFPIDQVNRLTVVVDGYEFKLYINGVLQTTLRDNRILKGATGLYLDMGANTTLDWEFDDFVIYTSSD